MFALYYVVYLPLRVKAFYEAQGVGFGSFIPIVGDLFELMRERNNEIAPFFTGNANKLAKFGKFWGMFFGPYARVFCVSPDHIQDMLGAKAHFYSKNENVKGSFYSIAGNGLFFSEGELWKHQRHVINPLFTGGNIDKLTPLMVKYVDIALNKWKEEIIASGQQPYTLQLLDKFAAMTLDIIGASAVGESALNTPGIHKLIYKVFNETLSSVLERSLSIVGLLPILKDLPFPSKVKIDQAADVFSTTIQKIIDDRAAGKSQALTDVDLLDMLLSVRFDADGKETMSLKQVKDEVVTLILAGHETTSNTLNWFFYEVTKNPDIWKMIKKEVDEVLGGKFPDAESIKKLEILRSCCQETLRFWPVVPFAVRDALVDNVIGEKTDRPIKILAGTTILVPRYRLHRLPEFWENPDTFDPLRFTRATEHGVRRHLYQYTPFGGGKRNCIGNTFAMNEMLIIAAMIFQRFEFTYVEQLVCPLIAITMRPKYGVKVDVRIRN